MVETLLENARWAPTHKMTQPWRFKVFMGNERERLGTVLADSYKAITPDDAFAEEKFQRLKERPLNSSVVVAVCMKRDEEKNLPEEEEIAAVACAVQNMHLTATAYGLGGCWSTDETVHSSRMKDFLGIGPEDRCLGLFYLGYPAIEWPKGQRKPMEYYVEWFGDHE